MSLLTRERKVMLHKIKAINMNKEIIAIIKGIPIVTIKGLGYKYDVLTNFILNQVLIEVQLTHAIPDLPLLCFLRSIATSISINHDVFLHSYKRVVSFLNTCSNHPNLFSHIVTQIKLLVSVKTWFLMLSILLCPQIHNNIHISSTFILAS